ncbi:MULTISPECIES: ABC-three component system middle component 7 [Pectobacterium]|uniref:ABC-three component system middle component 7 n=1 Tax=Pectobacterium TaxID=122277 RepID=UPI002B27B28B|nr:ABC-three component system middle component 7 [Pectobacterium carotovorum]
MITPSKSISIQDSILYKMTIILETEFNEIKITDLYEKISSNFLSLDEFVYSLDFLFILEKIILNPDNGMVIKC